MWILSITPDWFLHLLLVGSAIATLVGFTLANVPLVSRYAMMLKVLGAVVLALSLYLEGGLADNKIWEARVKEVEAKLAQAEAKSAKENVKIVEKIVTKQGKVKENTVVVKQYIDREVVKYDAQCKIPQEFVKAHNDAAQGPQK
jgi:uncharacterized membrane protein